MAKNIDIGGRLHSVATEHIVAGANEIQDDTLNKTQAQINEEVNNTLEIHDSAIEGLNSQNYASYTATVGTTAVTDVLPDLGAVNTVYRLGNWDGTQYDTTQYAEYAWITTGIDQGEYVLLDVKNYGIDDEPTAGSDNLIKSEGVFKALFGVLTFVGNNTTYMTGGVSNGILLNGHHYRIHLLDVDVTGLNLSSTQGVIDFIGKDEDGNDVTIIDIRRGTDSTFICPEYIDYKPSQNVYALHIDGRTLSGKTAKAVIEDFGIKEIPLTLTLIGKGDAYSDDCSDNFTLYKGRYIVNIEQWDVSGLSYAGGTLIIIGFDSQGDSHILVKIDNRETATVPEYVIFDVDQTLYNVTLNGRVVNGDKGIVTIEKISVPLAASIANDRISLDSLHKHIPFIQGTFPDDESKWATDVKSSPVRVVSPLFKADDVIVNIPKGFHAMVRYGNPSQTSMYKDYMTGSVFIRKSMNYVRFLVKKDNSANITPDEVNVEVTTFCNDILVNSLNFPLMGCGTKMISLPRVTYVHAPVIVETANYIFIAHHSCETLTYEFSGGHNEITLIVIDKMNGEQWYEKPFLRSEEADVVDGNICSNWYNHSMVDISDNEVVINVGCLNDGKWIYVSKTYNAATKTLSDIAKCQLSYNGNTVDFNIHNYIEMVNTVYGLSIPVVGVVGTSEDIWSYSKFTEDETTKFIGLCAIGTSSDVASITPYVMMKSVDVKTWEPMFMLCNDKEPAETRAIVKDNKIYIVTRVGSSFGTETSPWGSFYGVCDMGGNFIKNITLLNSQRTKPCEVVIGDDVYIIYNAVGGYNGKYWGRTKVKLAKVNSDYSITDLETYESPFGINYPYACNHNGAILMAYCEDMRGLNVASGQNAITDIAIAQIFV